MHPWNLAISNKSSAFSSFANVFNFFESLQMLKGVKYALTHHLAMGAIALKGAGGRGSHDWCRSDLRVPFNNLSNSILERSPRLYLLRILNTLLQRQSPELITVRNYRCISADDNSIHLSSL